MKVLKAPLARLANQEDDSGGAFPSCATGRHPVKMTDYTTPF